MLVRAIVTFGTETWRIIRSADENNIRRFKRRTSRITKYKTDLYNFKELHGAEQCLKKKGQEIY